MIIALISLLTVVAIDEFKSGDRYYFSISNASGGIAGGNFSFNITDMNMSSHLQTGVATEMQSGVSGIYYINISGISASTEPRVLQINGSYGISDYLDMVDMIYIVGVRKTEILDNLTTSSYDVQSNLTTLTQNTSNLANDIDDLEANFTSLTGNASTLANNIATLDLEVGANFTTLITEVDSVEENQATLTAQINTNTSKTMSQMETNTTNIISYLIDTVYDYLVNMINANMGANFTRLFTNVSDLSINITDTRANVIQNNSVLANNLADLNVTLGNLTLNTSTLANDIANLGTEVGANVTTLIGNTSNLADNIYALDSELGANFTDVQSNFSTVLLNISVLTNDVANLTDVSANVSTLLDRIGNPGATNIWDYINGTITQSSNTTTLIGRIWNFVWRSTYNIV